MIPLVYAPKEFAPVLWKGPCLDGTLILSQDKEVRGVIFFCLDSYEFGIQGNRRVDPALTVDILIEEIKQIYMNAVMHTREVEHECLH